MYHKDLDLWKQSISLAKAVYQLTESFPQSELYGLTSQMRRSAVSIPSNIAEGAARSSDNEFIRFLYIVLGSLAEVDTQYILSQELRFTQGSAEKRIEDVRRMTLGLLKHLKNKVK